eukprot:CAMPEP_0176402742 /NCGR_PEP_ID=MMETSP0126-20121128/49535_1 /TAXON_ID=141414 ORGANISM="Strombidinopsis acuminatum, Strain SPMC142" /NCGR_SAMPLE_ID=MMETSP0126 /ASSEMBLY_ACC=CAM_ASM_000229 /LENGTH=93 /DNA_ID=CAMNT_0017780569 /DNA_START=794 /DNA_END=1075 /DNA_ORIENTATION=-
MDAIKPTVVSPRKRQRQNYKGQGLIKSPTVAQSQDSPMDAGMVERRNYNRGGSNLVSVNVSSDGNRLVGPLGLKKAEQELIKRRYKYMHGDRD